MTIAVNLIRHAYSNFIKIGIKTHIYHKSKLIFVRTALFFDAIRPIKQNNVMIL